MLAFGLKSNFLAYAILVLVCLAVVIYRSEFTIRSIGFHVQEQPDANTQLKIVERIPPREKFNHFLQQTLPVIYLITPTYKRSTQKADLTRMSHTLKLVKNVHWIVIEDSETKTKLVENFLKNSGIPYTHLNVSSRETAARYRTGTLMQRGITQRNIGLSWLKKNPIAKEHGGVLFFADDDNTYSLRLFDEMRYTKRVSVWPVGLLGGILYETPIVHNGMVVGWFAWSPRRRFAIDMCGFAINLKLIFKNPTALFTYAQRGGRLETGFLSQLDIGMNTLEPKANNCTEILVWHTRTQKYHYGPGNIENHIYINGSVENREELIKKYMSYSNFEV